MRQALKRLAASVIRTLLVPCLSRVSFRGSEEMAGTSVHTLVHAGNWRLGLISLSSFMLQTGKLWRVFVHEDGSLGPRDITFIRRYHPEWNIVPRKAADVLARLTLSQCPCLLERRAENNLMVKFVDPFLYAPHGKYLFIDPDVFFFTPPRELLKWAVEAESQECWFMREYEGVYAYSFAPERLRILAGGEVNAGVNTGLCLLAKQSVSFQQAERFLKQLRGIALEGDAAWYIEQTLFAIVATLSTGGLLPRTYGTGYDACDRSSREDRVACHYVGPTKNDRLYYDGILSVAGTFTRKSSLR